MLESLGAKNLKCKIWSDVVRDKTEVESERQQAIQKTVHSKWEWKASNGTVKGLRTRSEKWAEGSVN